MRASKTAYTFRLLPYSGATLLEAQEWPWTVAQIVPVTPADRAEVLAALRKTHGVIVEHDRVKSFYVVHSCSGDQGGRYPERHVTITQNNYHDFYNAMCDVLVQASVWYVANVIEARKN